METVGCTLVKICKNMNICIKRMGFVIQSNLLREDVQKINDKITLPFYKDSNEKNVSWVSKKVIGEVAVNEFINIQINENNLQYPQIIILDVNTQKNFLLNQDEDCIIEVITKMLDEIEEGIKNVF